MAALADVWMCMGTAPFSFRVATRQVSHLVPGVLVLAVPVLEGMDSESPPSGAVLPCSSWFCSARFPGVILLCRSPN